MGGGPPGFPQGFTCPVVLGILLRLTRVSLTGLLPSSVGLPMPFCYPRSYYSCSPTTPAAVATGLGSFPFARRYLGNRLLSFFSYRYLDVSVPCVRLIGLCIHPMIHGVYSMGVAPFGYLRIKDCLRLPEAFRSLPRPSSPLSAKASAICPFYLHLQIFLLRFFVRYAT